MTLVKFSTLFTSPLFNAANIQKPEQRGSTIGTFQFNEMEPIKDNFVSNPLHTAFKSKAELEQIAKNNPRIIQLCKEYGIPLKVNIEELEALKRGHLQNTRVLAAKICSNRT